MPRGTTATKSGIFPDGFYAISKVSDRHGDLLRDVERAASLRAREQASQQYCGSGLEQGVDNGSLRLLFRNLEQLPQGNRLAETLVMIASAGRPNAKELDLIKHYTGDYLRGRCRRVPGTLLHGLDQR